MIAGLILLSFVLGLTYSLLWKKIRTPDSPVASPSSAPSADSPCGPEGCDENRARPSAAAGPSAQPNASFAAISGSGAYASSSTQSREEALRQPAGGRGRPSSGSAGGDPVAGSLGFASGKASGNVDMNTLNPSAGAAIPSGASATPTKPAAAKGGDPGSFIQGSKVPIVALIYANWCGHCKTFKPIFEDAATKYTGKTIFITIDADEQKAFCQSLGVGGFPTVIRFDAGKPTLYSGQRTLVALLDFAK